MKRDEGDARLLAPVTERIDRPRIQGRQCARPWVRTKTPLPVRCESPGSALSGGVVFYDDGIVGEYIAELMVEGQVIVELKVAGALSDGHVPQCRND